MQKKQRKQVNEGIVNGVENKPDRCHHCRICRTCVLKMDHHCPWIFNCVGYHNYKPFYLLITYGLASAIFLSVTISSTIEKAHDKKINFNTIPTFLLYFTFIMSSCFSLGLTIFWSFHTRLLTKNMSTIEFCEKNVSRKEGDKRDIIAGEQNIDYDLGMYENIQAALGPWYMWLIPTYPKLHSGLEFPRPGQPFDEVRAHMNPKDRKNNFKQQRSTLITTGTESTKSRRPKRSNSKKNKWENEAESKTAAPEEIKPLLNGPEDPEDV